MDTFPHQDIPSRLIVNWVPQARSWYFGFCLAMKLIKPDWVSHAGAAIYSIDIHPDGTRFATGGGGSFLHASKF